MLALLALMPDASAFTPEERQIARAFASAGRNQDRSIQAIALEQLLQKTLGHSSSPGIRDMEQLLGRADRYGRQHDSDILYYFVCYGQSDKGSYTDLLWLQFNRSDHLVNVGRIQDYRVSRRAGSTCRRR